MLRRWYALCQECSDSCERLLVGLGDIRRDMLVDCVLDAPSGQIDGGPQSLVGRPLRRRWGRGHTANPPGESGSFTIDDWTPSETIQVP